MSLVEALQAGGVPQLEELDIRDVGMGEVAAEALAQALEDGACPRLQRCLVPHNPGITDEAKERLCSARPRVRFTG